MRESSLNAQPVRHQSVWMYRFLTEVKSKNKICPRRIHPRTVAVSHTLEWHIGLLPPGFHVSLHVSHPSQFPSHFPSQFPSQSIMKELDIRHFGFY